MQLQCRQAIECYTHYYCSCDCKMLLDTGCKDSWVPVKQQKLWHAHLQRCQYSRGGLCITRQITRPLAANIAVKTSVFTTTLLQRQCAAVHAPNSHCRQHTQGQQEQVPVREATQHALQTADQGQQEEVPVRKAPNIHHRQQTKVNRKRYLSERHPTCITGSRERSTGRGTCQKGTQHASQAADKGG
jgi:hypothetical protein